MMTQDRRAFLAGAGALASMLAGCTAERRTHLVLGDQMQILRAKMEAAKALDGLDYSIEWANFPGAAPLFEAVNAGAVDTAPAADLPAISAAIAGCKLRIPAVTRSSPAGFGIIVPAGSPLHRVADLAGRSVIVSSARGSITHYFLLEALREAGVPADRVHIGFMLPTEASTAFAAGQFDAWVTFGVYLARAEQAGGLTLRNSAGLCPNYGVIAVAEHALANPAHRAALSDFLHRARRANDWARDNLDAYARVYAARTGTSLTISRVVVEREHPALFPPDRTFVAEVQRATDRFVGYGVFPHSVAVAALIDTTLL